MESRPGHESLGEILALERRGHFRSGTKRRSFVSIVAAESVLLDLGAQRLPRDSQEVRGARLVPADSFQGVRNPGLFHLGER